MKFTANEIRNGWVILHNGARFVVTGFQKVKPGKGGAFMQVEMKNIDTGAKGNERFRSEDSVEKLMAEDIKAQFLYSDGTDSYFMDLTSFEQFTLSNENLGEQMKFLQPEMEVVAHFIEGAPMSITLPKSVVAVVVETEPALNGQTAAGGGKPAILDNGIRVQVPTFISVDEKIVVNTETLEYVERAK